MIGPTAKPPARTTSDSNAASPVRARTGYYVTLVATVFILYLYSTARVINLSDSDLGRHLKNGEIILSTGTIPSTNLFSYTHPDVPFVNHHWGAGVVYSVVHQWFGFEGLRILNMILQFASVGLWFGLAWRWTRCELAVLAAILAEPLIGGRCEVRPEFFSTLFLALFFVLLWQYRQGQMSGRWLWILPVLEALWVNLHIFFPFGPILIGIFLLEELFPSLRGAAVRQGSRLKLLLGVWLSCGIAMLINPWGLEGAAYPFMIFQNYGFEIRENLPTFRHVTDFPEGLHFAFVFGLIAAGALVTAMAPERRDRCLPVLLVTVIFGVLAWRYWRGIAVFGYVAVGALPLLWDRPNVLRFVDAMRKPVAVLVLCGVAVLAFAIRPQPWMYRDKPGLGLEEGNLNGAVFLRENKIRGPIFNTFNVGNYLIYGLYPDERVFVDGRPEAYPASFFQEGLIAIQSMDNEEPWQAMLRKYDFNVVVLHTNEVAGIPGYAVFFARRCRDPLWAPVFLDSRLVILLRRTPANKAVIDRFQVDFGS